MKNNLPAANACDATRERLLRVAGEVFAEVGYEAATTREICTHAQANAAAVNYHFRDKLGLYTEVLKSVIGDGDERTAEQALLELEPTLALRQFVSMMLKTVACGSVPDLYSRLMMHELSKPTAGLAVVVEHMIRPRARLLCQIIAKLTGRPARDARTRLCAHSVIGQVVHYRQSRAVMRLVWPDWQVDDDTRNHIVDHVTRFSLAGMRESARERGKKQR